MICSMMSPIKEFLPLSFFFCFFSHYSDCCMFFSGNVYVCRQGRSSQGRPGWIVKPLPSQISGFGSQLASSSCSNPLTLGEFFACPTASSCIFLEILRMDQGNWHVVLVFVDNELVLLGFSLEVATGFSAFLWSLRGFVWDHVSWRVEVVSDWMSKVR